MHSKKQRIISFLMAFLLIFTFAFINPLTVSKSHAFAPAVVLSAQGVKIIAGVLVSAGLGIIAGQSLQEVDYDSAITSISTGVYNAMDFGQKMLLLSIITADNIIKIPVDLYNHIVEKATKLYNSTHYESLAEQQISIRYGHIDGLNLSELNIPFYYNSDTSISDPSTTYYDYYSDTRTFDMRDAIPFIEYETTGVNEMQREGVKSFFLSYDETQSPYEYTKKFSNEIGVNADNGISLTTNLTNYTDMQYTSGSSVYGMTSIGIANYTKSSGINYHSIYMTGSELTSHLRALLMLDSSIYDLSNLDFKSYFIKFIKDTSRNFYVITDIYNHTTGEFEKQVIRRVTPMYPTNYQDSTYGINKVLYDNVNTTVPTTYDIDIVEETTKTPTVEVDEEIVITLPETTTEILDWTSADTNVGTTDIPETGEGEGSGTNTETMENINTNVGELVTGGELGEQVNTNIGSVEGLHGEITEQVDFGAVFDTIAQYISALDISSVTWFPTAVASFLVPFLPVISLGLILFFIDRVLNGGA